jgi:hypothetical protein
MTPAERAHTKLRLAQRYGLKVTSADLFRMAKLIAHGQATFLDRQSRHVARWQLDYQGQALRLVFDAQRRAIITALPPITDRAGQ